MKAVMALAEAQDSREIKAALGGDKYDMEKQTAAVFGRHEQSEWNQRIKQQQAEKEKAERK